MKIICQILFMVSLMAASAFSCANLAALRDFTIVMQDQNDFKISFYNFSKKVVSFYIYDKYFTLSENEGVSYSCVGVDSVVVDVVGYRTQYLEVPCYTKVVFEE